MIMKPYTYKDLASAYVRGCATKGKLPLPEELVQQPLKSLTDDQKDELVSCGKAAELKMHYFKEKEGLARVQLVMGFLRGMVASGQVSSLLDVGIWNSVAWITFMQWKRTFVIGMPLTDHLTW